MGYRRARISTWTAIISGIFSAFFALPFVLGRSTLPIFRATSEHDPAVTTIVIITSFLIPLLTIGTLYRRFEPIHDRVEWHYGLVGRIGSAILGALFFTFIMAIILYLLDKVFPTASVPIGGALVLIIILNSALGFIVAYIAVYFNTKQLLILFAITFVSALSLAASTAEDRTWWSNSLSFLGWDQGSNLFFDLSLILGGLLILAVSGDIIRDLREIHDKGYITAKNFRRVQIMILLIAISIITAGLFPTRVSTFSFIIHQGSAFIFFGLLLFMMGGIKYLLPIYSEWFITYGRGLLIVAFVFIVAYKPLNLISFVLLEIILFIIVAVWTYVFAQQTDQVLRGTIFSFNFTSEFLRRLKYAFRIGFIASICGAIATFLLVYDLDYLVIVSREEISFLAVALLLVFPIVSIATGVSYRRFMDSRRGIFARIIISMVMAFLSWFVTLIVIFSLDSFFTGVTVTVYSTVLFFAVLSFGLGFGVSYIAVYFDEMQELLLTGVLFAVGLVFATTHAADPLWWQNSISFLGHDSGAFLVFSITMILCGLLLIVVGNGMLKSLEEWQQSQSQTTGTNHLGILHWILVILGLCTVGIGLFPTTVTQITNDLHNISSHGMLLMFILLMFGLNRLVPSYPRIFIMSSYAIGVVTILNVMGFFAGVYNYVIMEFFLAIILGTWLYLFVRYTREITGETNLLPSAQVHNNVSRS